MTRLHDERLLSLDLFRGITMMLLLAEGTRLFYFMNAAVPQNTFLSMIAGQFLHAQWHGMHFWDLIQPYFTFVIGIAMAFSLKKRWDRGDSWMATFKHIVLRCAILFSLGIILQSGYREKMVWELWNILTQLSVSILITFMIFRFPYIAQIVISFFLLFATEMLFRYISIDGFDQPFVKDHNFGAFMDLALMGKLHPDGWVAINCIPTTAHMIWGGLTGNLLLQVKDSNKKIKILGMACIAGLVIGYGLDWIGISPINKKISTGAFVIASGGWCMLSFVVLYWLVDIKGYNKLVAFFAIVGMNPIFIYVFSRTVGRSFLNDFVEMFFNGFIEYAGLSEGIMRFASYIVILGLEWYLCYWLYKKRIFIKI
jgi:predicted acyltransferase